MLEINKRKLEMLSQVGLGSLAKIYAVRDTVSGEVFAVKMLRPEWQSSRSKKKRFLDEGDVGVRFSHPNIVRYHYAPKGAGASCILMELVNGTTLEKLLVFEGEHRRAMLPALIRQLAAAVTHVHAKGYIHRDVTPHNIMVTPDDQVKLIDFGLCLGQTHAATMRWQRSGTPGFMAPEQIRFTTSLTPAADIYAFASVIYLLVAGHEAFPGATPEARMTAQINRDPPPPSKHNPAVPAELDSTILRAMDHTPRKRPDDAELLAGAVCRLAAKAGIFQGEGDATP
jgi:serine/threonine-protein kinase